MTTTLVLTRKPDFVYQNPLFPDQYGRFGTLIVLQGAPLTQASVSAADDAAPGISVPGGILNVTTSDGGDVTELKRFTTIERAVGYIQLTPQAFNGTVHKRELYGLKYEPHNSKVIQLSGSDGKCFRVLGGLSEKERAILIHAAPHVGWLEGCIGPRRLDDHEKGYTDSAFTAMDELIRIAPQPSALLVVDW